MYQLLKQIAKTGIKTEPYPQADEALRVAGERLRAEILESFVGALTIRHVDAGSCTVRPEPTRSTILLQPGGAGHPLLRAHADHRRAPVAPWSLKRTTTRHPNPSSYRDR
jgi:hypothetical protein